ncbi:acyltransferase family protein [Acetobacter orleanensis]|nr:acyltransferase [Acetobacter orleanensis]PCD79228.1 acyltransferase [Acetobacter orleanensis]GBR27604.1 putative acyltransferase [Acetobacter orleanensis NRIC 0473]
MTLFILPLANQGRNAGIDVLRGLAILMVVVNHVAIRLPLEKTSVAAILPYRVMRFLTHQGYHSVFVFFVISGFLITSGILRRWGRLRSIQLPFFYARRFSRIVPCLLVLLSILVVLDACGVPDFTIDGAGQTLGAALASALGLYLNKYECWTGYLPANWDVLWSLSIEELFYLIFPVICLMLPRSDTWQMILFGSATLALPIAMHLMAGETDICRHKAYLPGVSALSAGVIAALLLTRSDWMGRSAVTLLGWMGVVGIFLSCVQVYFLPDPVADDLTVGLTLSTGALLIALSKGWGAVLRHRTLAWVRSCGVMSYEIYLTHMFFVLGLVRAYHATGFSERAAWVCYPLALGGAWLLGYGTDRFLSYPAEHRLRALFTRWFPTPDKRLGEHEVNPSP